MANVKTKSRKAKRASTARAVRSGTPNASHGTVTAKSAVSAAVQESTNTRGAASHLSSSWTVLKATYAVIVSEWRYFLGFAIVTALLNILFVHNFASDVQSIKEQFAPATGNNPAATAAGTYAYLVTASGGSAGTNTAYLYVLLVLCSLACIWALRTHATAAEEGHLQVRRSFYEGMYPLVPFVLVLFVLTLELLPFAIGSSLLSILLSNGIAATAVEQVISVVITLGFAAVSMWLLLMSWPALYIVTLPGSRPWQALKDAKKVTRGRRLSVLRKLLFLILVLLLASAAVLIPAIVLWASATAALLFVFGIIALPFVHTYLYMLYRELIGA